MGRSYPPAQTKNGYFKRLQAKLDTIQGIQFRAFTFEIRIAQGLGEIPVLKDMMMSKLDANLKKLAPLLERYSHEPFLNHIDGQDVAARSGDWFDVHSPIDHSRIGAVPRSDAEDVAAAARAAKLAFPGWRDMPAEKRKHILHAIADAIDEHAEEIGLLEAWDTGQPLRLSLIHI